MTDSKKLRSLIESKGLKLKYIAERLGISYYGLKLKIDNHSEFKTSEVNELCKILGIKTLREKEDIFFACRDD